MHPLSGLSRYHWTDLLVKMVNHACVWSKASLICNPMMWEGSALLGVLASEPKPYRLSPQHIHSTERSPYRRPLGV